MSLCPLCGDQPVERKPGLWTVSCDTCDYRVSSSFSREAVWSYWLSLVRDIEKAAKHTQQDLPYKETCNGQS